MLLVSVLTVGKNTLAYCKLCGSYAHCSVNEDLMLQKIPEFTGKLCFDSMHAECCKGSWDTGKVRRTVSTNHFVYIALLAEYKIPKKKGLNSGKGKV